MKDTDGRRFRSERTREALIAACAAYMRQAHIPSVAEIAERAGCSQRTVFWHFTTLSNLQEAGLAVILAQSNKSQNTRDIVPREEHSTL